MRILLPCPARAINAVEMRPALEQSEILLGACLHLCYLCVYSQLFWRARRHREECEHRERVTTRSLEKVLGDLLSCKEDLHLAAGIGTQNANGDAIDASKARRELIGGKECASALRGAIAQNDRLADAVAIARTKERTNQLQIDNLQSTLHKSEFYQSKKWVKGKALLEDKSRERPFRLYVYDMPKFNIDFYNSHTSEYESECKNQIGERHIHQLFETSPHRVADGETADLYFVPVYTGCYRSVMGRELKVRQLTPSITNLCQYSSDVKLSTHVGFFASSRWTRTTQRTTLSKKP